MKYTLRARLSLSYVLISVIGVLSISILANVFLERQFKNYVIQKQERDSKNAVGLVGLQYGSDGTWNIRTLEEIGVGALEQGLILKVTDASGKMIWDATVHNNGLCVQMLSHMAQNMTSRYPNWKGGYVENSYPVIVGFKEVGKVEVGYFGPYFFNDNDLAFINTLNAMLFGVGLLSLVFALVYGSVMARRISGPISRVVGKARMISEGSYGEKISEKSGTKEISLLTETINEMAEHLERQDLLRKRMSADVAHELRTPLATLQSHIEAMIDGVWEPNAERLKSCHEEITRMGRLVGDLERLARFEGSDLRLNRTRFDLGELMGSMVRIFQSDFLNKGVELVYEYAEAPVNADRDKISQVAVNLLSNALKYTPGGGRTEVLVRNREDSVEFAIRDNGQGIPEEDLPYIFERFYRADKSRNRLTGGSGIGLTIAKTLVDAHHGEIRVISKLNEGTEFTVILPKSIE